MEPGGLLLWSQDPDVGFYPEPIKSSPHNVNVKYKFSDRLGVG